MSWRRGLNQKFRNFFINYIWLIVLNFSPTRDLEIHFWEKTKNVKSFSYLRKNVCNEDILRLKFIFIVT